MQTAVNHWIMVEKIAERKTSIIVLGETKQQVECYCRILSAGPLAKLEEAGMKIGDMIAGPRILFVPGLPNNVGLMSAGDVFYKLDELPEGVSLLDDAITTVDDVLDPKPNNIEANP